MNPAATRCAGHKLRTLDLKIKGLMIHALVAYGPKEHDRPPVILLHGQGTSSRFMKPSARELARDFPVLAPDQPGYGLSEAPPRVLDVAGLADFLVDFMDACELERVALVGTSFGWLTAVDCAVRHPHRVTRLVLQGPLAAPSDRGALRLVQLWRRNGKQEPADTKLLLSEYRRAGFIRVFKTFNYFRHYPVESMLPRVGQPSLVVRGDRDQLASQGWAEQVTALLPDGRLVVAHGPAHTMSRFGARELADAARPFLLEKSSF